MSMRTVGLVGLSTSRRPRGKRHVLFTVRWLGMGALLCTALTPRVGAAGVVRGQVQGAGVASSDPFSCNGPRDLIVEKGRNSFSGTVSYDHVCVIDGGILSGSGSQLTLHVGALYVARDSAVEANGVDGYLYITHDCIGNDEHFDGDGGGTLTIVAREATIDGRISADGGHGLDNSIECQGDGRTGNGGAGGNLTLIAASLHLSGTISARGGDGGSAAKMGDQPATPNQGGNGGTGGSVDVELVQGNPAAIAAIAAVSGGQGGARGKGAAGSAGRIGRATSMSINASAVDRVVAAPLSPVTALSPGPAFAPATSPSSFATLHGMACGRGNLHLASGTTRLDGAHSYHHVCLDNGATLVVPHGLVLSADTILLAPGSSVVANGPARASTSSSPDGRYASGGACASHGAAHAGISGAGAETMVFGSSNPIVNAGGGGGGQVALVAKAILMLGTLSARGGAGADGTSRPSSSFDFYTAALRGGDGGSGGGISLIAPAVRIGGPITVAGGSGGGPGGSATDLEGDRNTAGAHGSAGCIKMIATTVASVVATLPLTGETVLARPVPSDPVPPVRTQGVQYDAAAGHNLGGAFLRYWRMHGGLNALGAPASEAFVDGGRQVQYTERALLQLIGGQVVPAPLGRALAHLTPAQAARVPAFTSTASRQYVPATGHSLSGTFLRYWQTHDGATRLGAPLSEVFKRNNGDGSGRSYPTQWFEYGRLEYHAENAGTRYAVRMGLLGIDALRARGWLP